MVADEHQGELARPLPTGTGKIFRLTSSGDYLTNPAKGDRKFEKL